MTKRKAALVLSIMKGQTSVTDAAGREVSRSLPDGITTTDSYDAAGELVGTRNSSGNSYSWGDSGNTLSSQAYVYNAAGERTYTVTNDGAITAYQYDAAGRLTGVSYPLSNDIVLSDLKQRMAAGLESGKSPTGTGSSSDGHHWDSDVDSAFGEMGTSGYRWYDENSLKQSFDALGNSDNWAWIFGRGEHHGNFGSRLSV